MSQTVMDLEQLAELSSRLVQENSAWRKFIDSAVERILQRYDQCLFSTIWRFVQRHDIIDIENLIEMMQKFVVQEIMYQELISQVTYYLALKINVLISNL